MLQPLIPSPNQRDGDRLYATLQLRKIDDTTVVRHDNKGLCIPAGWKVAPGDKQTARVCGAHAWQGDRLILSDDYPYRTAGSTLFAG
jgi:hypothetical protein